MDKRTPNWTDAETDLFLDLCLEKHRPTPLTDREFCKWKIFSSLTDEMLDNGYDRNQHQLLTKYKQLKVRYQVESSKCKAIGREASTWEHYDKMAELSLLRPAVPSDINMDSDSSCSSQFNNQGDGNESASPSDQDPEKRKANWNDTDISLFISLCTTKKKSSNQKPSFNSREAFNSIRDEMAEKGYTLTSEQLQTKYRQLKERFRAESAKCKDMKCPPKWHYYKEMTELMDGQEDDERRRRLQAVEECMWQNSDLGKRDVNWTDDETLAFLDICIRKNIPSLMDRTKFRNIQVFNSIRPRMIKLGYNRTAIQLLSKYKQLKARHKKELEKCGSKKSRWRFFDKITELNSISNGGEAAEASDGSEDEGSAAATSFAGNDSFQEFESIFVRDQGEKKSRVGDYLASNTSDVSNPKKLKVEMDDIQIEETSFTENTSQHYLSDTGSTNKKPNEKKGSSFKSILSGFSEQFFQRQREMNQQFMQQIREMFREQREYYERARKEDRRFLESILLGSADDES